MKFKTGNPARREVKAIPKVKRKGRDFVADSYRLVTNAVQNEHCNSRHRCVENLLYYTFSYLMIMGSLSPESYLSLVYRDHVR